MDKPIILARNIHKTFRNGKIEVHALAGVDLSIAAGEMVAVMGPSGCGKTTLINCLSGLDSFDTGEVEIEGASLRAMSDRARTSYRARRMGFVFQTFNLLPRITAVENVELPLLLSAVRPREARQRALRGLTQVGLAARAEHRPAELSGGERQRVTGDLPRTPGEAPRVHGEAPRVPVKHSRISRKHRGASRILPGVRTHARRMGRRSSGVRLKAPSAWGTGLPPRMHDLCVMAQARCESDLSGGPS